MQKQHLLQADLAFHIYTHIVELFVIHSVLIIRCIEGPLQQVFAAFIQLTHSQQFSYAEPYLLYLVYLFDGKGSQCLHAAFGPLHAKTLNRPDHQQDQRRTEPLHHIPLVLVSCQHQLRWRGCSTQASICWCVDSGTLTAPRGKCPATGSPWHKATPGELTGACIIPTVHAEICKRISCCAAAGQRALASGNNLCGCCALCMLRQVLC